MKILKIRKKFQYKGIELQIVDTEEILYLERTANFLRVIAPNGGIVPVNIQINETLKSIVQKTIEKLDGFEKRGCDVIVELTKEING